MTLSDEARRRFAVYVDTADPSNTNPDDDTSLVDFAAWALLNDRDALSERFAFQSTMAERGFTADKIRYVQTILRAAPHLVDAIERQRVEVRRADEAESAREEDQELGGEA